MFLAQDYIDHDMLILHGDLVFSQNLAADMLTSPVPNCAPLNRICCLSEKDFKGRLADGKLLEVSVRIFDEGCLAFQPFYKLEKAAASTWIGKVTQFVVDSHTKCYAENALNEILPALDVSAFYSDDYFVEKIDTIEDFNRVAKAIQYYDSK